jgi:peptidoglycan L-alanyl-D-glutamate endopeptidase CwlK
MSDKITDLAPETQPKARTSVSLIQIPYVVVETLRTTDTQVAYYAQGRAPLEIVNLLRKKAGLDSIDNSANGSIITHCDGVNTKSNHQSGHALDVVPANSAGNPVWPAETDARWQIIAKAGKAAGLKWGGDFPNFPDYPHWEDV